MKTLEFSFFSLSLFLDHGKIRVDGGISATFVKTKFYYANSSRAKEEYLRTSFQRFVSTFFFFNNEKNSKLISKKNTFSFQKHPRLLFTKLSSMMIRHLFLATKYRDTVYIYI